jgi:transaldolase
VNTMPETTIAAFDDHGTLARTVDADPQAAERTIAALGEVGVDLADVTATLEDEGVHSFAKSFDELIQTLTDKASALGGSR